MGKGGHVCLPPLCEVWEVGQERTLEETITIVLDWEAFIVE